MPSHLCLLHTVGSVVESFGNLAKRVMPGVQIRHCVDENILKDLIEDGQLGPRTIRRVCQQVILASDSGADGVLLTCSSISPCADIASQLVDIPVMKIDESMAEEAVSLGTRLGVLATVKTTLEPTVALLNEKAKSAQKDIEITTVECAGAFGSLQCGDVNAHDKLLAEEICKLNRQVEVIVLAQASMARVAKSLGQRIQVPVLTSIESGLKRALTILGIS